MTATLTDAALLGAAGDIVFARGQAYTRYVRALVVSGSRARATVRARNAYEVELSWTAREVKGYCTCPHFARGWFCKHLVAVGLVVIDEQSGGRAPLATILEESETDDHVAGRAAGRSEGTEQAIKAGAQAALRTRGYVDYRRSFETAARAQVMLDDLEEHLDGGRADLVRPALLYSLTRLRAILLTADDSAGVLGEACQRAADLYARSCRDGRPDEARLGRWLARFRADSPGWPDVTLDDFASALGVKGLAAYRRGVAALDARTPRTARSYDRFEIGRMLLELADHDGDVDGAIALLSSGEHARIAAIITRLRRAGRDGEVLPWIDRAVEDKRVSARMGGDGDYWLTPEEVAKAYLAAGRVDDALDVLHTSVLAEPGHRSFAMLLAHADRLGRCDSERQWALEALRQRAAADRYAGGAALVEIALAEGDAQAAWAAADEFGAGHARGALAAATATTHPSQCAALHRASVTKDLQYPNSSVYPSVAATLVTIRRLSEAAGEAGDFADYLAALREEYRRRPALMAALARVGL